MRAQRLIRASAVWLSGTFVVPVLGAPPSELPRLAPGTRVGIIYSSSDPVSGEASAPLWGQCVEAGIDTYQLALSWSDLEPTPGVVDTAYLSLLLDIVQQTGFTPYLVIQTANTNLLSIPPDLKDPAQGDALRADLTWDSPELLARFDAVIDAVVPRLVARGGFYLAVGNEVDIYLKSRPAAQTQAFAAFVAHARDRAHTIEPELAVGANLTIESLAAPPIAAAVLGVSDAASFTYYMTEGAFTVRDAAQVGADLDALLALADGKPVLLQEVGYPSGWRDAPMGTPGAGPGGGPTNQSSEARQAEFVRTFFDEVLRRPQIRYVSVLQVADWSSDTLDLFEQVYGFASPEFRQFLGTLGLAWEDGTPKAGFAEFLTGVCRVRRARVDFNGDTIIDFGDIAAFVGAFLVQGGAADLNADGIVDSGDIQEFLRWFLADC